MEREQWAEDKFQYDEKCIHLRTYRIYPDLNEVTEMVKNDHR
jgi:hypothetical protein